MRAIAKLAAVLAVSLAALLPFVSTLHDYFIADDFGVVQLLAQKPAFYFPKWFVSAWMDNIWGFTPDEIRPFPAISFQISALWGAASPVANHVINIALHVLNALLVFSIARRVVVLTLPAAVFAGMLFAVLPLQAETVAWITGRVDSIPALFYLSSFLLYVVWRRAGGLWVYWASVAMFFAALFSKQTAITMLATLVVYDVLIERKALRSTWSWLRDYVPFALLTGFYLLLRYFLFGQAIRESAINVQTLMTLGALQARHLQTLILGNVLFGRDPASPAFMNTALALTCICMLATFIAVAYRAYVQHRTVPYTDLSAGALLLYFGPVWWLVSTAPTAVAGYQAARHLYVGSVGFAIVLGIGFDGFWRSPRRLLRYASVLGGMILVLAYAFKLELAVADWSHAASLSRQATIDVARLAAETPAGSLLIVDPPVALSVLANSPYPQFLWAWALPFALRPPFAESDVTARTFVISPRYVHCCDSQWFDYTHRSISQWAQHADRLPVISLRWDAATGAILQKSDTRLRDELLKLVDVNTGDELTEKFHGLINELRVP